MDLNKLGRTEQVLAGSGLLLFIVSFFPWFSYSVGFGGVGSISGSMNGWSDPSGFNDWFPVLLLLVYGVVLALPAFGVAVNVPQLASPANRAFVGLVLAAFAVLLFAIQGLTYPSIPAGYGGSMGPAWGYYLALVIALAAGVQSYLGFTQQGGSFAAVGAAFKARTQAVQQQGQAQYGQPQQQPYQQQGQTLGQPSYGQQPYAQPPQDPQFPQQPPQQEQQPPTPPYGS